MKLKIIIPIIALAILASVVGLKLLRPKQPMNTSMNMDTTSSTAAPISANTVSIQNYKFNPNPLKIKKGTTVKWTNNDIAKHSVTVDDNQPAGGPSSSLFGKNETYEFTFASAVSYHYHCDPHPYMHGVVEVTE